MSEANEQSTTIQLACGSPKLLFSSFGFQTPDMRGKYGKAMQDRESIIRKTCAIVPYAGFNLERTVENERDGLVKFGFSPERIYTLDAENARFSAKPPDYIYVPGGNPFRLMAEIQKRSLRRYIRSNVLNGNTVYIGVSAGAYIAAPDLTYVKVLEPSKIALYNYESFNLIPCTIVCHAEHYSEEQIEKCERVSQKQILTLQDDQLICCHGGLWSFIV